MRSLWIENIKTRAVWDLLPRDPYNTDNGCGLTGIAGMGYSQDITQNQVGVDYFISEITSTNEEVTGTLNFNGDEHLQNFQAFIGDFRKQFRLYYSPDGSIEPYDQISKAFYKEFVISEFEKTEKDEAGWYSCSVTFTPQSDVWKRDYTYSADIISSDNEALIYPYKYEYLLDGRGVITLTLSNGGRETGCIVQIKNISDEVGTPPSPLSMSDPEWYVDHEYDDYYGYSHTETQRAKFYSVLAPGTTLKVDSNALTQEALLQLTENTSQSVVSQQEPSWDYINFVQLKHGKNRFVFYIDADTQKVNITVSYSEQKEII